MMVDYRHRPRRHTYKGRRALFLLSLSHRFDPFYRLPSCISSWPLVHRLRLIHLLVIVGGGGGGLPRGRGPCYHVLVRGPLGSTGSGFSPRCAGGPWPPAAAVWVFGRRRLCYAAFPASRRSGLARGYSHPVFAAGFAARAVGGGLGPSARLAVCWVLGIVGLVLFGVFSWLNFSSFSPILARLCSLGARGAPVVAWVLLEGLGSRGGCGVGRLGLRPQRGVAWFGLSGRSLICWPGFN